ncbi:MAG: hypothetical protein AB1553_13975 [Nitrospirota bacterium]
MPKHHIRKGPPEKEKPKEQGTAEESDEGCRCKEVAKKSPSGLFKLMIRDLKFWEKEKKDG